MIKTLTIILLVFFHQMIWTNLLIMLLWFPKKKRKISLHYSKNWQLWKRRNTLVEYTRYRAKTRHFSLWSFGLDGLKHFIIQDDQDIIEKVLFGTEKMTKTDSKIPLFNIRFNFNNYKNLTMDELDAFSETAANFFRFVWVFSNKLKLPNFANIWMVKIEFKTLTLWPAVPSNFTFTTIYLTQMKTAKYKTKLNLTKTQ